MQMGVVLFVRGEITYGRWIDFLSAARHYCDYRREKGYVVPEMLLGMSGPMNTALLVYRYSDAKAFEDENVALDQDKDYARVASAMPYIEGTIDYELFREG